MELNKKNLQKLAALAAGVVLLYWGLQNLDTVAGFLRMMLGLLTPFLFGMAIAFVLNVPMRALEKLLFRPKPGKPGFRDKLRRPVSLLLSLILVTAAIFLLLFLVVPEVNRTLRNVSAGFPDFVARVRAWSEALAQQMPQEAAQWLQGLNFDWENIGKELFGFLRSGATSILSSTFSIATSVFSGIFNFAMGLVFSIYILLQKEKLSRQSRKLLYAFLPERAADRTLHISRLSNRVFSNYIRVQCLEALILGSMFFVAMTIFRFPYALMVSVLIAFMALIPVFGAFIGLFVGAVLILVTDPIKALWFVVLFMVLQQIEGNLIYPRVVGSSVGLPALWVLVAVTLGGSTMGVLGMLIYVPLFSVIYTLVRESVQKRLVERRVSGRKYQHGD